MGLMGILPEIFDRPLVTKALRGDLVRTRTDAQALEEWTRYEGPRGGKGWKKDGQGKPRYQEEMPGGGARDFMEVAKPLRPVGQTFSGGTAHQMDVAADRFVHFTTRDRAAQILQSGRLLMRPPHPKFGTDSVDAVSLTYGRSLPSVQSNHLPGDLVAVVFKTTAPPEVGYAEEVKWHSDVPLLEPQIVSVEEARKLLANAQPIGDQDEVVYRDQDAERYATPRPKTAADKLADANLILEPRGDRTAVGGAVRDL